MKVSICVPVHEMDDKDFFFKRCVDSIEKQDFTDYEIVFSENGEGMAANTNAAIRKAKGELIKILFLDDYFAHEQALSYIVENFTNGWLVTGCIHDDGDSWFNRHFPVWSDDIHTGNNTIGSPSVVTFENKSPFFFDADLSWTLDVDFYKRLYQRYGEPVILNDTNVVIGVGNHQTTHKLTEEQKLKEQKTTTERYS